MIEINIDGLLDSENSVTEENVVPNVYSEDDSDGETTESSENKKRKRKTIIWTFQKQFENDQFVEIEIEPKWSRYKSHPTLAGQKVYYKCKFSKCLVKIHLLYLKNQARVSLFSNQGKKKRKINLINFL